MRLEEQLAARVRLTHRGQRGRLEIYFESLDELDRLIDILSK